MNPATAQHKTIQNKDETVKRISKAWDVIATEDELTEQLELPEEFKWKLKDD